MLTVNSIVIQLLALVVHLDLLRISRLHSVEHSFIDGVQLLVVEAEAQLSNSSYSIAHCCRLRLS
jgi:hypothetical protein